MSNIRKFAFETEFAADGAIVREATKRLGPEEVEAERKRAYESGKRDALVQAERETTAQLENIATAASAVLTRLDAESRAMREEAARVAIVAARRIAGAALDAYGGEQAMAAVEAAMEGLRHQPRIVVRLPPALAEALRARIAEMSAAHAYAGAVLVRAEPSMKSAEVAIDWGDGVVRFSPEEAAERINALVDAALASAAAGH